MANIGTSNYAVYAGVPAVTVTWLGGGTTSYNGTVYGSIEKTAAADISNTTDNSGEIQAQRDRNKRIQFRMTIKPVAATAAASSLIAGDLPRANSIVTIVAPAAESDLNASGTNLCDDASTSYTPDGDVVVNLTVTKHLGKTFGALT